MRTIVAVERIMSSAMRLVLSVFDPRGRCNRRGLLLIALALLAIQALTALAIWLSGAALDAPVAIAIKLVFLWLAIAAAAKRLHDTGRSAWGILWSLLAIVAWSTVVAIALLLIMGDRMLVPGSGGFETHFALTMLPVLAATLWLHFAPGEPQPNRYGPSPSGNGIAAPLLRADPAPALAEVPATA